MTVYCSNCSHPLPPDGWCPRCSHKEEPHCGSWPEYYAAEKRFLRQESRGDMWLLAGIVICVVILAAWAIS